MPWEQLCKFLSAALYIFFSKLTELKGVKPEPAYIGKMIPRKYCQGCYAAFEIHFWGEKAKSCAANSLLPPSLQGCEQGASLPGTAPRGCFLSGKEVKISARPIYSGLFSDFQAHCSYARVAYFPRSPPFILSPFAELQHNVSLSSPLSQKCRNASTHSLCGVSYFNKAEPLCNGK